MNEMSLFDRTVFDELNAELGAEDTAEVLKTFLADTSRKMSIVASDAPVRPTIKREAHAIKSSSATFGFVELSRLARELESSVETMGLSQLQQVVETFRQTFDRTSKFAEANLLDTRPEIARCE
jgi:HPt (histidine-containing phosphotransfer) domain-containing protein